MSVRPLQADAARGTERAPLRVVRRRSRRLIVRQRARVLAPFVVATSIFAAVVIAAVLLEQVVLAQSAFKLDALQRRMTAAQARHQELLLRSAKLGSPARVERYATARLGMVQPGGRSYIVADLPGTTKARLVGAPARAALARAPSDGSLLHEAAP